MSVRSMRSSTGDVKEAMLLPTHNPPPGGNKEEKVGKALLSPEHASSPVVAGGAYCCVSAAMVLLNKFALSGFDFTCPNTLLLLQCSTAVVFVKLAEVLGFWKIERLRWDIVRIWLPVNVLFVMMLATGVWSLQLLGVGMVTIMKNMTNLLTISGDYMMYGRTYNLYVWMTLGLITGSALVGATTDLSFTWWGYSAQFLNCLFTAGYSLLLRGVMDKVKGILGEAMPTHSQVYYNNLLSLPFVCLLAVIFGEPQRLMTDPSFTSPSFHTVAGLSCIVSFSISYSTLWFLSTTTPTTYGLVGSLNKIPVAVIGMVLFKTVYSTANIVSIGVGLLAGVLFVRAKQL